MWIQTVNSLEVVFFSFLLLLFCFVLLLLFFLTSPKKHQSTKERKQCWEQEWKPNKKAERKKNIEGRIKECSGGPAELSSRGLGFLQRKFRYMFVCLHFQIGAVGAGSEEKNKSNANFRGGDQCSRLLTGPPGYCKQPIARCAHLLKY